MKGRELRTLFGGWDTLGSVFELRRTLVNFLVVAISHSDDRGAWPSLDMPDLRECAKEAAGFDHGSTCAGQFHANLVVNLPLSIIDIEKVSRHHPSDPSHTGLVREKVRGELTMVSVQTGQSRAVTAASYGHGMAAVTRANHRAMVGSVELRRERARVSGLYGELEEWPRPSGIPSFHETATSLSIALDRCITSAKRCMRGRSLTSGMLGMSS